LNSKVTFYRGIFFFNVIKTFFLNTAVIYLGMAVNYRDILTLEKVGFFKFFFFAGLMSFGKTA
jgi:hypothetical protein